jgi:hypothetical protein
MTDIKAQPYAEWLESVLRQLVDMNPQAIGIVAIMPDGSTGTQYYNADARDLTIMREAIMLDYLTEFLANNADLLREIVDGEADDE